MKKFCKFLMMFTVLFTIVAPFVIFTNVIQPMLDEREQDEKDALYRSDSITVSVTDKINASGDYYGGSYYEYICKFNLNVTNYSSERITFFQGIMTVKNGNQLELITTTVSFQKNIESWNSYPFTFQFYSHTMNEIWNIDFEDMNIYFRITELTFNNSVHKYYDDNEDVLIKRAGSGSYDNQEPDDFNNVGNNQVQSYTDRNVNFSVTGGAVLCLILVIGLIVMIVYLGKGRKKVSSAAKNSTKDTSEN